MAVWPCRLASVSPNKAKGCCCCGAKLELTVAQMDLDDQDRINAMLDLYREHLRDRVKAMKAGAK